MRRILPAILLLFFQQAFAQHATNAGGNNARSESGSFTYSVGEVFYDSFGTSTNVSQGTQQGYEVYVESALPEHLKDKLDIKLYPNPTTDYLELLFNGYDNDRFNISIYNASGNPVDSFIISDALTRINTGSYPAGIYFVHIGTGGNDITVYKVVKK